MKYKPNHQDEAADELAEKLEAAGAIITKGDRRVIRQAFERHFRKVHTETLLLFAQNRLDLLKDCHDLLSIALTPAASKRMRKRINVLIAKAEGR